MQLYCHPKILQSDKIKSTAKIVYLFMVGHRWRERPNGQKNICKYTVEELSELVNVSPGTIRNCIEVLEKYGLLTKKFVNIGPNTPGVQYQYTMTTNISKEVLKNL